MKSKLAMLLLMVVMTLSFSTTKAQNTLVVSGGISVSNDALSEEFQIGADFGKSNLTAVLKTTDATRLTERQWYGGVNYARTLSTDHRNLEFFADGSLLIGLRERQDIVFQPGLGVNLKLSKSVYLQGKVSTPIGEDMNLFRPVRLSAGTALLLRF